MSKRPASRTTSEIIATDGQASSTAAQIGGVSRRAALQALLAAGVALPQAELWAAHASTAQATVAGPLSLARPGAKPRGTLTDPDLRAGVVPWPTTLDARQLATLGVLAGLIIPADEHSPSAAELGCQEFIDEWISAPYPDQQRDRMIILAGLDWLAAECTKRYRQADFRKLNEAQQKTILDDICVPLQEPDPLARPSLFFSRVRGLTCGAFWTTAEGMRDLQYIGNQPLARWDLPPPEVLKHLNLLD